jgi:hypothetical protein
MDSGESSVVLVCCLFQTDFVSSCFLEGDMGVLEARGLQGNGCDHDSNLVCEPIYTSL